MNIEVVDYNSKWKSSFGKEADAIKKILQDNLINIFHIGSTSVPGLAAKPIIDILPVVRDIQQMDGCSTQFEALEYNVMGEYGISGRRFYIKGGSKRTHHIHAFQYDNTYAVLRHLAFRDYLRCHPKTCYQYAELKKKLAEQFSTDRDKYCDGKEDFVKRVEQDALEWYWSNVK